MYPPLVLECILEVGKGCAAFEVQPCGSSPLVPFIRTQAVRHGVLQAAQVGRLVGV